jgi:stress-induced morphogen
MKIFIIILLLFFIGCSSDRQIVKEDKVEVPVKENASDIKLGWADEDTYTVRIISKDLDGAIDSARHKILQDIVRVRMLNDSRFTDISKISGEFEKPLKQGTVLKSQQVSGGLEIYYQIRDQGLKKKFERK